MDGVKLAWSVADYLASLAQDVTALAATAPPAAAATGTAPKETASMPIDSLLPDLDLTFSNLRRAREAFVPNLAPREIGTLTSVSTGIATVSGLRGAGFEELIQFPGGLRASRSTWTRTRLVSCCSEITRISTPATKSPGRVASWM